MKTARFTLRRACSPPPSARLFTREIQIFSHKFTQLSRLIDIGISATTGRGSAALCNPHTVELFARGFTAGWKQSRAPGSLICIATVQAQNPGAILLQRNNWRLRETGPSIRLAAGGRQTALYFPLQQNCPRILGLVQCSAYLIV